jgi:hypothetical protein
VSPSAYAALTPAQREALRSAGREAAAPSVHRLLRAEQDSQRVLCRPPHGDENLFQLIWTTPSELAGLRWAVRPVYRGLERDATAQAVIAAIQATRRSEPPRTGIVCRRGAPRSFRPPAVPCLRVTGDLRRVGPREWSGAATSDRLGRGRLIVRGDALFRDFPLRRSMTVRAAFPRGQLRGWVNMRISPNQRAGHAWEGSGVFFKSSPQLRRYRPASLRFSGVTNAGRPHELHGGFVTDAPTGLH